MSGSGPERRSRESDDTLGRWVAAGLINEEQAAAIRRYEAAGSPARRLPPAAEAIADVGIVLGLAAAAVLWGRLAGEGEDGPRLILSAGIATALLLGGFGLRRLDEPGFQRIASALWLLGSLAIGIAVLDAYAFTGDITDPPSVVTLAAGVPMLAVGWFTHALSRRTPTLVGAFAGTVTTGVGLVLWLLEDSSDDTKLAAEAGMLAVVGTVWLGAALMGALRPRSHAGVLGVLPLLAAPLFIVERATGTALLLGVAACVVLMGIGVKLPGWSVMIVAALGLFGYLTGMLIHFFEDSLGVPLVLLIAAALMIVAAAVVVRLRRPVPADPGP